MAGAWFVIVAVRVIKTIRILRGRGELTRTAVKHTHTKRFCVCVSALYAASRVLPREAGAVAKSGLNRSPLAPLLGNNLRDALGSINGATCQMRKDREP
jgi:hypothetical protein